MYFVFQVCITNKYLLSTYYTSITVLSRNLEREIKIDTQIHIIAAILHIWGLIFVSPYKFLDSTMIGA